MSAGPPTVVDLHVASTAWTTAFTDYLQSHGLGDEGFRIPLGSSAQTKSLPWLNINQVILEFSEDADVQAADLSLSGVSATAFPLADFSYVITHDGESSTFVATWTFAAALSKNTYQIDLDGNGIDPVTDVDGNVLDGDWTNNSDTMPSGNGSAGGDFAFLFKVMPGDGNQNNGVEYADYYAATSRQGLTTTSSNYNAFVDIDGSGSHTQGDSQAVYSRLWSTYQSGSPAGVSNDAPTSAGGASVEITNAAIDVVLSLWDAFADAETADNQLNYQVISNSNAALFDSTSINSATGSLVLNAAAGASGVSEITVRATDAAGLSVVETFHIHVNHANQRPTLDFEVMPVGYRTWLFVGNVYDDDDVEGLIVTFSGATPIRATVAADGSFEFAIILDDDVSGSEWGTVADREGLWSYSLYKSMVAT